MNAKVRESSKLGAITACSGVQYNRHTWIPVPPGREDEAIANPFLIVDDEMPPESESIPDAVGEYDVTNSAYELAYEYGIDLSEINGTGNDGRILKRDVEQYLEHAQ